MVEIGLLNFGGQSDDGETGFQHCLGDLGAEAAIGSGDEGDFAVHVFLRERISRKAYRRSDFKGSGRCPFCLASLSRDSRGGCRYMNLGRTNASVPTWGMLIRRGLQGFYQPRDDDFFEDFRVGPDAHLTA